MSLQRYGLEVSFLIMNYMLYKDFFWKALFILKEKMNYLL